MGLVRISGVTPLDGFHFRLVLTDGSVIERDVESLLVGPVFATVRDNPDVFRAAKVAAGTVVWPNGADLCPDVLIWGGPPRGGSVPDKLALATHWSTVTPVVFDRHPKAKRSCGVPARVGRHDRCSVRVGSPAQAS